MSNSATVLVTPRAVSAQGEVLASLRQDEVLHHLIERFGPYRWELQDPLYTLVRAVVGQRISGRAAGVVFGRLRERTGLAPTALLTAPVADLRALGLPESKALPIQGLAAFAQAGGLDELHTLPNEAVIRNLVALKGIGPWTAHMFLIFCLGRLDVWPVGDLGVVNVARELYGVEGKGALENLGERFAPYQSVAVWYFWRFSTAKTSTA